MSYLGICCISPAADGSVSVVHVAHDGLCFSRQLRLDSDATLFVAIDREAPLRWLLLAVVAADAEVVVLRLLLDDRLLLDGAAAPPVVVLLFGCM